MPGERRVALTPKVIEMLTKVGAEVWMESGAGVESGYPDEEYVARGAKIGSLADVRGNAQYSFDHPCATARRPEEGPGRHRILRSSQRAGDRGALRRRRSHSDLHGTGPAHHACAKYGCAFVHGIHCRIQSGADRREHAAATFPDDDHRGRHYSAGTRAGFGAGVAGLQAIATARRLGAVVSGYDVRSAVKEQIESLGAKFVNIDIGAAGEGQGGYAVAL